MSGRPQPSTTTATVERRVSSLPTGRVYGGGTGTHDGVFANMSAKPQPGEEADEKPPVSVAIFPHFYLRSPCNVY